MVHITQMFHAKQLELLVLLLGGRGVIGHPGERGAATEENWRRLLRAYLPTRYQVVHTDYSIDIKNCGTRGPLT